MVAIGGGTGLPVLLRGLKQYTSNLTAIVNVADDGGSSGRLRGELGILPPGDLRNCLIALADTEKIMEDILSYRFQQGSGLAGHSVGNLLLAGLTELTGDFHAAIRELSRVLALRGQVVPATLTSAVLGAEMADGEVVMGESQIPRQGKPIRRVFLEPADCRALEESLLAIKEADLVVLSPGSLYTSIMPNLLVQEIASALTETTALVVYVCNVMTQPGETNGYTASDHLQAINRHVGGKIVDLVVVNTATVSPLARGKYREEGAKPVVVDYREINKLGMEVVGEKLIDYSTVVRHNPDRLARVLLKLVLGRKNRKEKLKMLDFYLRGRLKK
ncbi:MAG TPA: YvcK family protein [Clostridia bacterium]|nr:YvcK family protein [Clostridia bacterium]